MTNEQQGDTGTQTDMAWMALSLLLVLVKVERWCRGVLDQLMKTEVTLEIQQ